MRTLVAVALVAGGGFGLAAAPVSAAPAQAASVRCGYYWKNWTQYWGNCTSKKQRIHVTYASSRGGGLISSCVRAKTAVSLPILVNLAGYPTGAFLRGSC